MSEYLLYPGCSIESSAKSYYESMMAICKPLNISLKEIDDWNCCGATEYLSLELTPAYSLIAVILLWLRNKPIPVKLSLLPALLVTLT